MRFGALLVPADCHYKNGLKWPKMAKIEKSQIFLETMDPGGDFGMVITQFGRVVIFWQVSKVGGQLVLSA